MSPTFFGTTVSARAPLFPNESALVDSTPARMVVWPGATTGDDYDPFTGQVWSNTNQAANASTNESDFVRWCRSIDCSAILEVPGEIDNPSVAEAVVNYTERNLSFHPAYWEIGNEPGFWIHWDQPWGSWTTTATPPTPTQYAAEVARYVTYMRNSDPTIKVIGLPGIGKPGKGTSDGAWISALIQAAGPDISAIAVHVYPDLSAANNTLSQFYATLNQSNIQSIPGRVPTILGEIAEDVAEYCPTTCGPIPLFFTEIGSAITGRPDSVHYGEQFPGALYMAAEIIQAAIYQIPNVDAYATVLDTGNSWFNVSGDERPLYELQSQILSRLGNQTYPVSFDPDSMGGLYGIATHELSSNRSDLLVVNTNLSQSFTFTPEFHPYAIAGYPTVIWSWTNGTTSSPVATYEPGLPGSYTLPPNSLVLFQSQNYSVFPVRFAESGLPSGTRWFLTVDGFSGTSRVDNLTFYLPNGTSSVRAGPPVAVPGDARHERWNPSPPSEVIVNSAGQNLTDPYLLQATVTERVSPSDSGTVTPTVSWWTVNSSLELMAQPSDGWVFHTWVGGGPGNYSGPGARAKFTPRGPVNETADFVPGYLVNFTEAGLPAGATWNLTVAGQVYSSDSSSIYLLASNGTHGYRVAPESGYYPSPASGSFTVNGSSPNPILVAFTHLGHSRLVTFTETGLANGTNWSVVIRHALSYSSSSQIAVYEENGSYSYNVTPIEGYNAHPPHGGFVVDGADLNISIQFQANSTNHSRYAVTFSETGLPAGTNWTVDIRGITENSSGPDITFFEPNGTYEYRVGNSTGLVAHPQLGGFTLNGSSISAIPIRFTHPLVVPQDYPVVWDALGLPNGTAWSVEVRQLVYESSTSFIVVAERNGTYSYSVDPYPSYVVEPARGVFRVAGAPVTPINITFEVMHLLTFSESGLPTGSEWSIRMGSHARSSDNATITFEVPNGVWPFVVVAPPHTDFVASPVAGQTSVNNSSALEPVFFVDAPATTFGKILVSIPTEILRALLVGGAIAGISVATFILLSRRRRTGSSDSIPGEARPEDHNPDPPTGAQPPL